VPVAHEHGLADQVHVIFHAVSKLSSCLRMGWRTIASGHHTARMQDEQTLHETQSESGLPVFVPSLHLGLYHLLSG